MRVHSVVYAFAFFINLVVFSVLESSAASREVQLQDIQLEPPQSSAKILTLKSLKDVTSYTLAEIESLGLKRLRTSTFWPEDDGVYEGVLLARLLANAGIEKCTSIIVSALDEYQVEIPCSDFEKWPVLLATRHEGKSMSIRNKGPTRIIYPKDIGGEVALSDMRSRWIWAIESISVKN